MKPENTGRKGMGWGIAQFRGRSPEGGAVGGVLTLPTWGLPVLSLSASCGPLCPRSLILPLRRQADKLPVSPPPLGPSWGSSRSWQADVRCSAPGQLRLTRSSRAVALSPQGSGPVLPPMGAH